jgi:nitric oxide reductase NorD protein
MVTDTAPLGAYLRLLWDVAPPLVAAGTHADGEPLAPFLSPQGLHLPEAPCTLDPATATAWRRATAAHAAAHLVFSRHVFERAGTPPITQALIGVLEDARVEALACRQLPGLRRLWVPWHTVAPADGEDFETLLLRLARALADPAHDDPHPWVRKGRARFYLDAAGEVLADLRPQPLRQLASALGHDLGQMRTAFNPRLYRPGPSCRDDNRCLWQGEAQAVAAPPAGQAVPPAEAAVEQHAEWDHRIGRSRENWCTVHERRPPQALEPAPIGVSSSALATALRLALARPAGVRLVHEADEIDLDAAVGLAIDRRLRTPPDLRIHRQAKAAPSTVAVLVLVDASHSSARHGEAGGASALDAQKAHAAALARSAASLAHCALSVRSFRSDGRHAVDVDCVLDFGEAWDEGAQQRLAGLAAGGSTRLGAALRHAARALTRQEASRRIVIVLGDGEPYDIDIHDPRYLVEDARHAAQTAALLGVEVLGLLHADADATVARRVFGGGAWAVASDAAALPQALRGLLRRSYL